MAKPIDESPVRESASAYHVTAWPEWLEKDDDARADALMLSISVERQGREGLWALFMGLGEGQRPVWTAHGRWIPAGEPRLLPLDGALALARELAPEVSVMRWTAREAIRDWTQQKGQGPRPDFPIENPLAQQGGVGPPAAPTMAASRRSRSGPPAAPTGPRIRS